MGLLPIRSKPRRTVTIADRESAASVDEVAAGIYRICTPMDVIPGGFTFNSYLIDDEEPVLLTASRFETGQLGDISQSGENDSKRKQQYFFNHQFRLIALYLTLAGECWSALVNRKNDQVWVKHIVAALQATQ